jgi:hypothetical protein
MKWRIKMGRLIDADKFIKKFNYAKANTEEENIMCATVRKMIREEPTAFDLYEVVEQLKQLKTRYFLTIANTGDKKLDIAYENVGNVLDRVIEIIKGGGI